MSPFYESDLPPATVGEISAVICEAETIILESYTRATEPYRAKLGRVLIQGLIEFGKSWPWYSYPYTD